MLARGSEERRCAQLSRHRTGDQPGEINHRDQENICQERKGDG